MKVFGYVAGNDAQESSELSEIALLANPDELRKVARFLKQCARDMDSVRSDWEHDHLVGVEWPDFVVVNSDKLEESDT